MAGLVGQVVWLICQVCLTGRPDVTGFLGQMFLCGRSGKSGRHVRCGWLLG